MPKFIKFIAVAIPFLGVAIYLGYRDFGGPERMAFEGRVSFIEWESRNHGMPLIEVARSNGTTVKFSNSRIILTPSQLKVGDSFSKSSSSMSCEINGKSVQCIK